MVFRTLPLLRAVPPPKNQRPPIPQPRPRTQPPRSAPTPTPAPGAHATATATAPAPAPATATAQATAAAQHPAREPGAPNAKEILESFRRITPRQRLYISLGMLAFSICGVYATDKLEEWYPVEKRADTIEHPGAKSKVDIQWELEEQELEKLEASRAASARKVA